jgi:Ser/Thr protein kinase RdoA (MazF antagonist)
MLDAVERLGVRCDGSFLALNSYENRVYQIGIEDAAPLVVKFYRPERWSEDCILEEHAFARELAEREIPVVAPLTFFGKTLFEHAGFRYAAYPRQAGRPPELDDSLTRQWLGRFIGRIHGVGSVARFVHRPGIDPRTFGHEPLAVILESGFVAGSIRESFSAAAGQALERAARLFAIAGDVRRVRLHGDCHPSNVLWTEAGPHFVDLDDCRTGPPIQDLWMFLAGDRDERSGQLADLLEGYCTFFDFDPRELVLIEALRTLRIIYYAAWLTRRWSDPAFPRSFPWFNTAKYWEGQIEALQEQCAEMDEPPLEWR